MSFLLFSQFQVVQAVGVWYVFYFVITIFFCSFYLLNLVLAVVYLSYEKELQSLEQEVSGIKLILLSMRFKTAKLQFTEIIFLSELYNHSFYRRDGRSS